MALPENNITPSIVRDTLQSTYRDVGSLCNDSTITMWSKKKPIYKASSNASEWWKGHDGKCGYNMPTFNGTDTQIWTYNKPIGGAISPFDLGHFRGYDHLATINPLGYTESEGGTPVTRGIGSIIVPSLNPRTSVNETFSLALNGLPTLGSGNITLDDLGLYVGVVIYSSTGSVINWGTFSHNTLDQFGSATLMVDVVGKENAAQITVKFFLTPTFKRWTDTYQGLPSVMYSLPRTNSTHFPFWENVSVSINSGSYTARIESNGYLYYDIYDQNYTGDVFIDIISEPSGLLLSDQETTKSNDSLSGSFFTGSAPPTTGYTYIVKFYYYEGGDKAAGTSARYLQAEHKITL